TESAYARLWAGLLANGFVDRTLCGAVPPYPGAPPSGLADTRAAWLREVARGEIPWYLEQKIEEGAYATLLGVEIRLPRSVSSRAPGRIRALAVGDSCLFLVRDGRLARAFPVRASADFGNRPKLVGSRPGTPDPLARGTLITLKLYPGDVLYLTTDALACYLLRRQEEGNPVWAELDRIVESTDDGAFTRWLDERRQDRLMRNDDVALLRITRTSRGELCRADAAPGG
ncbi:MAG TPA: hypothetical protein VFZ25_01245, partial [Chloroflexota bacterium]|nr:hypothetical protein [Chloroflexota bacterium]